MKRTSVISFFVENHILSCAYSGLKFELLFSHFLPLQNLTLSCLHYLVWISCSKKQPWKNFFGSIIWYLWRMLCPVKRVPEASKTDVMVQVSTLDIEFYYKCLVGFSTDRDYCMRQGYLFANFVVRIQCIRKGVSLFACHSCNLRLEPKRGISTGS